MAAAYLKVWVGIGKEKQVREALKRLPGVRRADLTTGEQDIIALLEAEDYPGLLESILSEIRTISGVERTVTNLVLD
jgi:DNA-binding Lrp family transcriptional regulator